METKKITKDQEKALRKEGRVNVKALKESIKKKQDDQAQGISK